MDEKISRVKEIKWSLSNFLKTKCFCITRYGMNVIAVHKGKVIDTVKNYETIQCDICGFIHTNPIPTEEEQPSLKTI
jgi:hypothetical protein